MAESHKSLAFRDYLAVRYALAHVREIDVSLITTEDINAVLTTFYENYPEYAKKTRDD